MTSFSLQHHFRSPSVLTKRRMLNLSSVVSEKIGHFSFLRTVTLSDTKCQAFEMVRPLAHRDDEVKSMVAHFIKSLRCCNLPAIRRSFLFGKTRKVRALPEKKKKAG